MNGGRCPTRVTGYGIWIKFVRLEGDRYSKIGLLTQSDIPGMTRVATKISLPKCTYLVTKDDEMMFVEVLLLKLQQ